MFYINDTSKNVLKLKCSFSSHVAVRNLLFNNLVFFLHKGNFILIYWKIYTWVHSPGVNRVRVSRSLVLYLCVVDRFLSFCTLFLAIVLSVLLRYTDSDYPFGIFKLFLQYNKNKRKFVLFWYHFATVRPHCVDMRDYLREMTFNYFEWKFSNYIFLSVRVHHSTRIRYQSISNTLS